MKRLFVSRRARAVTRLSVLVLAVVLLLAAAPAIGTGGGHHDREVVATGLDNPRGVAVGWGGRVFVAEAGRGGEMGIEFEAEGETEVVLCFGLTGSVTEVRHGHVRELAALPSYTEATDGDCEGQEGIAATGPHDVAVRGWGRVTTVIGLGATLADRDAAEAEWAPAALFGTAQRVLRNGNTRQLADLAAFEESDPDGEGPDSNPYGVARSRRDRLVTDAGGNSLVRINRKGDTSLVAVFAPQCVPWELPDPNLIPTDRNPCGSDDLFPASSVPTDVVVGRDGYYYVSELGGFPFTPGYARIWKVDPSRSTPATCSTFDPVPNDGCEVYATGLTGIVDLAFAHGGWLYAVQIADAGVLAAETGGSLDGSVQAIAPGGGTPEPSKAITDLTAPGGIAIKWHTAYITNNSILPDVGELIKTSIW